MSIASTGMVAVSPQGLVNIKATETNMPVYMLKDGQGRSIAIPLTRLEAELLEHTLGGGNDASYPPQPYRAMLACLKVLGGSLGVVHIHYDSDYELPTHLVLRARPGHEREIAVSCSDGIILAGLTGIPILVDEALMEAISDTPVRSVSEAAPPR